MDTCAQGIRKQQTCKERMGGSAFWGRKSFRQTVLFLSTETSILSFAEPRTPSFSYCQLPFPQRGSLHFVVLRGVPLLAPYLHITLFPVPTQYLPPPWCLLDSVSHTIVCVQIPGLPQGWLVCTLPDFEHDLGNST